MKKPTFKFRFKEAKNAETFVEKINRETEGLALHPFKGEHAEQEHKTVLVKGTGSALFDIKLKDKCIKLCEKLEGAFVG